MVGVIAVSVGAALGALSRWGLGLLVNSWFPAIPPGTWLANVIGGYLMGLALAGFAHHSAVNSALQLLIMAGFLGSLTTFSAFSGEVSLLLQQGKLLLAALAISAHVAGSLVMTLLGMATIAWGR